MYNTATETTYRQELKEKILITAINLFHKHGIRSVKMDDIANELKISKRTLYEIYSNKEELLLEVVRRDKQREKRRLDEITARRAEQAKKQTNTRTRNTDRDR